MVNYEIFPVQYQYRQRQRFLFYIRHKVALVRTKHMQCCKLFWLCYLVVLCSQETNLFLLYMVLTCSGHLYSLCSFSLNSTADWQYGANEFVKQLPDDVIVHCKLCHFVLSITMFIFLLLFFLQFLIAINIAIKQILLWK